MSGITQSNAYGNTSDGFLKRGIGMSSEPLFKIDPRERGFWSMFNGLMEPLHFGNFGGLALKWLYFLLWLTPAFLSFSGTLIWIDRRKYLCRTAIDATAGTMVAGGALGVATRLGT